MDIGSTYNSQMRFGDDVITRIVYATEGGGLDELRDAVVADINTIVAPLWNVMALKHARWIRRL